MYTKKLLCIGQQRMKKRIDSNLVLPIKFSKIQTELIKLNYVLVIYLSCNNLLASGKSYQLLYSKVVQISCLCLTWYLLTIGSTSSNSCLYSWNLYLRIITYILHSKVSLDHCKHSWTTCINNILRDYLTYLQFASTIFNHHIL